VLPYPAIMEASSTSLELKEQESQLADVLQLLAATPDIPDPSLLSLKSDLEELIAITKQSLGASSETAVASEEPNGAPSVAQQHKTSAQILEDAAAKAVSSAIADAEEQHAPPPVASIDISLNPLGPSPGGEGGVAAAAAVAQLGGQEPPKKKLKASTNVSDEFEVPENLIIRDTDTDAEKNRKRRKLKAIKSKWREKKKEVESLKKQKSWQSFQKKKKVKKNKSVFSTDDGGRFTSVEERTRHNF